MLPKRPPQTREENLGKVIDEFYQTRKSFHDSMLQLKTIINDDVINTIKIEDPKKSGPIIAKLKEFMRPYEMLASNPYVPQNDDRSNTFIQQLKSTEHETVFNAFLRCSAQLNQFNDFLNEIGKKHSTLPLSKISSLTIQPTQQGGRYQLLVREALNQLAQKDSRRTYFEDIENSLQTNMARQNDTVKGIEHAKAFEILIKNKDKIKSYYYITPHHEAEQKKIAEIYNSEKIYEPNQDLRIDTMQDIQRNIIKSAIRGREIERAYNDLEDPLTTIERRLLFTEKTNKIGIEYLPKQKIKFFKNNLNKLNLNLNKIKKELLGYGIQKELMDATLSNFTAKIGKIEKRLSNAKTTYAILENTLTLLKPALKTYKSELAKDKSIDENTQSLFQNNYKNRLNVAIADIISKLKRNSTEEDVSKLFDSITKSMIANASVIARHHSTRRATPTEIDSIQKAIQKSLGMIREEMIKALVTKSRNIPLEINPTPIASKAIPATASPREEKTTLKSESPPLTPASGLAPDLPPSPSTPPPVPPYDMEQVTRRLALLKMVQEIENPIIEQAIIQHAIQSNGEIGEIHPDAITPLSAVTHDLTLASPNAEDIFQRALNEALPADSKEFSQPEAKDLYLCAVATNTIEQIPPDRQAELIENEIDLLEGIKELYENNAVDTYIRDFGDNSLKPEILNKTIEILHGSIQDQNRDNSIEQISWQNAARQATVAAVIEQASNDQRIQDSSEDFREIASDPVRNIMQKAGFKGHQLNCLTETFEASVHEKANNIEQANNSKKAAIAEFTKLDTPQQKEITTIASQVRVASIRSLFEPISIPSTEQKRASGKKTGEHTHPSSDKNSRPQSTQVRSRANLETEKTDDRMETELNSKDTAIKAEPKTPTDAEYAAALTIYVNDAVKIAQGNANSTYGNCYSEKSVNEALLSTFNRKALEAIAKENPQFRAEVLSKNPDQVDSNQNALAKTLTELLNPVALDESSYKRNLKKLASSEAHVINLAEAIAKLNNEAAVIVREQKRAEILSKRLAAFDTARINLVSGDLEASQKQYGIAKIHALNSKELLGELKDNDKQSDAIIHADVAHSMIAVIEALKQQSPENPLINGKMIYTSALEEAVNNAINVITPEFKEELSVITNLSSQLADAKKQLEQLSVTSSQIAEVKSTTNPTIIPEAAITTTTPKKSITPKLTDDPDIEKCLKHIDSSLFQSLKNAPGDPQKNHLIRLTRPQFITFLQSVADKQQGFPMKPPISILIEKLTNFKSQITRMNPQHASEIQKEKIQQFLNILTTLEKIQNKTPEAKQSSVAQQDSHSASNNEESGSRKNSRPT